MLFTGNVSNMVLTLPLSEGLCISFCGLYNAVLENYSVQNPPYGEGGL